MNYNKQDATMTKGFAILCMDNVTFILQAR